MVDDTTNKPTSSTTKRGRGRPRAPEGQVFRIQGARFDEGTIARLDRVLLHVFGVDVPMSARSELVRVAVRAGLDAIEYRISSGQPVDDTPLDPRETHVPQSSIATVVRAFRHAEGSEGARRESLQRAAETAARRYRQRLSGKRER